MLDDVLALVGGVFCTAVGIVHVIFYRQMSGYYFRAQVDNWERFHMASRPVRKAPDWVVRVFGILFLALGVTILVGHFHFLGL